MSLKLKALGLSVIAAMAISAVTVVNASATAGGHFVNDAPNGHASVLGAETPGTSHVLELTIHGLNGGVVCDTASYSGTVNAATVTQVDTTPAYANCHTTGQVGNTVPVDVEGCTYRFTVTPEGEKETVNGTADLVCPGAGLTVTHSNCWIRVPSQNNIGGISYTTLKENNKHTITLEANIQFVTLFEAKACTLLGTGGHTGTLKGSATVQGSDTDGNEVNITAT